MSRAPPEGAGVTLLRRKVTTHELEKADLILDGVKSRERAHEEAVTHKSSKRLARPQSHTSLPVSPLTTCSAATLLQRPAEPSFPRRRWTIDLSHDAQEDVLSPKWAKAVVRRASNRLVMEDMEDCDRSFVEMCGRLQSLIDQTVMRTLKFFTRIRDCHKERPTMLMEPQNFERLTSVSFMVSTVNYRLSKWLHQLEPHQYMKPAKPVESAAAERRVEELLRDVQFALSRMEVLASDLVPKLRKIISDARATHANPRFLRLLGPCEEPLSPGCGDPVRMAQRRGIRDVHEMEGVVSHLERLLEVSHALAFKPVPSQIRVSATILLAAQRFKKLLKQRRARK
ncbi:unnamed protein product [Effrenium voratum]|nr:unnamed protein product [Effrenium voratum]